MNIIETVITGVKEILSHKFQSFLTMLGVIFGVASVIAMVSIGEGAQKEALEQLDKIGQNTIIVNRIVKSEPADILSELNKSPYGLTLEQAQNLKDINKYIPDQIVQVSPIRISKIDTQAWRSKTVEAENVIGVFPNFIDSAGLRMNTGRFISDLDNKYMQRVCVMGYDVARKLFPAENPIGKKIFFNTYKPFICIGVLKHKEESVLVKTANFNSAIFIPFATSSKTFSISSIAGNAINSFFNNQTNRKDRRIFMAIAHLRTTSEHTPIDSVFLKLKDTDNMANTEKIISDMLLTANNGLTNFEIIIPLAILRQKQETQRIFNIVMGAIAGISLLVGGIGIMNIMLATVTQRTREIGIRRCLGATKLNILLQFIIESLAITILGGAIGVFLGVFLANAISSYAKWQTVISYTAIIYAIGVSTLTGLIFGLYPASKAASTDPITALKTE